MILCQGSRSEKCAFKYLAFEAKLNKYCNKWIKEALTKYMFDTNRCGVGAVGKKLQVLSLEAARVFIGGVKQTTDLAKGLRNTIRTDNALAHYKEREIFDEATFESIHFEPVKMVLAAKPKMYNLWHGKQCSGFCGTGKWLKISSQGKDNCRCPNYHRLQKDAAHLMVCLCANRTKLLHESIDDLAEWMELHHTDPALAKVIGIYLRGRGKRQFCVPGLP